MTQSINQEHKIYYTLRIASAMCCIGHGAWGVITKPIWCNYFAVFGIGHDLAYQLMPLVGWMDIMFGISLLLYPTRAVLTWLVIWGLTTAALRPLSGEPFAEMVERAGNFGAPLALLILCGGIGKNAPGWFKPLRVDIKQSANKMKTVGFYLRIIVFLLLLGHGWLNLIHKQSLLDQYTSLGFTNPVNMANSVGVFELIGSVLLLIKPLAPIILLLFIWKMGSELFYPHHEIFEWVERGGSYGSLLALYFLSSHFMKRKGHNIKSKEWGSVITG
jgi:hypothetical protein